MKARLALMGALFVAGTLLTPSLSAQTKPASAQDDVVRVNTELVQTDVMVFDKEGRFVDGLQREQFELLVDGKVQPLSFFEQIRTGSAQEQSPPGSKQVASPSTADNPGRTIIFFID